MANSHVCCNPFKQRNHRPESWRILPITKSLREQFRLYLGDDTNICVSCKRKLYETLPNLHVQETHHDDSIYQEIEEMGYWTGDLETETYSSNKNYDDTSMDDRLLDQQLFEEEHNYQRMEHRRGLNSKNISQIGVVTSTKEHSLSVRSTHRVVSICRKA